ncbi:MAG: phosphinothricin acetyltransferase [Candidatus Eremiobacteraeota bacterium]|nr:phosphinothricin acetyltransferase [Candidatus Eremiobacteraeota bacterium]
MPSDEPELAAVPASRVILRRVRRADADELIALNRASTSYHMPWEAPFTDRAGFDGWFERSVTGANVVLIARERATDAVVGVINFSNIVLSFFRSTYCGYWGYPSTGGRGLMTDALREAVRFGFEELGLHRIEANIQPGNARSLALARRAGFTKEGFSPRYLFLDGAWRDHERWAIVDDRDRLEVS